MITLNNFTKLDNGQYQMTLSMKNTDSIGDLPSVVRPMSPEYFAVTVDYGTPAEGSIVIKEDGEALIYSNNQWSRTDFKFQELFADEDGQYWPDDGYVGFNKVVVDVQPKIVMPAKGDLITIEDKQYRVLKTNGSVAEVLAMYNSRDSQVFDSDIFNKTYAEAALDTYLNQTFYTSLSSAMQGAIVAKTFQQDEWSWTLGTSGGTGTVIYQGIYRSPIQQEIYILKEYRIGLTNASYGTSISRKCYILSVQDVIDYLEVTTSMGAADTTLTSENVWKMFWNQTTSPGSNNTYCLWLCSADSASRSKTFYADGHYGFVGNQYTSTTYAIHPAFQIDLSKIEWAKSE